MSATPASVDDLQRALAEREAQIALLESELAETNQGVVALYAELEDKAMQLVEASHLKSRFLSYVSHEFRTPLSAMRGITNLMLRFVDGPLTEEQLKQVTLIRNSSIELNEMVDDLLDLAKVEAGRISISPEWFELVNLFSLLRGTFRSLLDTSEVTLIFEEPQHLPKIFTDDKKLAQILRNFIANALKFTQAGEVRVAADLLPGDKVKFSVTDTGIGIDTAHMNALFRDFSQLNNPLQKRLRGTGLGLSLSKKLAELLGGEVGVTSELGKGSVFWVVIPMHYQTVQRTGGGL